MREYNEIRNFLYARMRGHQIRAAGEGTQAEAAASADALLADIRDELRAIRERIEARHHV